MPKFNVPKVPYLGLPILYSGEWNGWDRCPVVAEEDGTLTIIDPNDYSFAHRYRRDDLEVFGRAQGLDRGSPEAFAGGQWSAELNARGGVARYVPSPTGGEITLPCNPGETPHVGKLFDVPTIARLWMPADYTGVFMGWYEPEVLEESGGILSVHHPEDYTVEVRFRRDELEEHGRAKSVGNGAFEAFAPRQWGVRLDKLGCVAEFTPHPEGIPDEVAEALVI